MKRAASDALPQLLEKEPKRLRLTSSSEDFFAAQYNANFEAIDKPVQVFNNDGTKRSSHYQYLNEIGAFSYEEVQSALVKKIDKETKQIYGPASEHKVGTIFSKPHEVILNGLHSDINVDASAQDFSKPATSILLFDREEHEDYGNIVIFVGERISYSDGNLPSLSGKNLSLSRNAQLKIPVRLIRTANASSSISSSSKKNGSSPFAPLQGYRYDGLYFVKEYWYEKVDSEASFVYLFKLVRIYGQPTLQDFVQFPVSRASIRIDRFFSKPDNQKADDDCSEEDFVPASRQMKAMEYSAILPEVPVRATSPTPKKKYDDPAQEMASNFFAFSGETYKPPAPSLPSLASAVYDTPYSSLPSNPLSYRPPISKLPSPQEILPIAMDRTSPMLRQTPTPSPRPSTPKNAVLSIVTTSVASYQPAPTPLPAASVSQDASNIDLNPLKRVLSHHTVKAMLSQLRTKGTTNEAPKSELSAPIPTIFTMPPTTFTSVAPRPTGNPAVVTSRHRKFDWKLENK